MSATLDVGDCVDDEAAGLWRCPYEADFVLQPGRAGTFQYQIAGTVNGYCNTTTMPFGPQPDPPETVSVATGQDRVEHRGRITLDVQPNPAQLPSGPATPSVGHVEVVGVRGARGVRSPDDDFFYPAADC